MLGVLLAACRVSPIPPLRVAATVYVELVDNPFTEEPYGIGVKKDDDDFRDFINDTLEEIFENGEWEEAYKSTVGEVDTETPEPPEVDRYETS